MDHTKYERARIVGARALQISMGAPFMIKLDEKKLGEIGYNPVEIAKREFSEGLIPINVKRPTPLPIQKEENVHFDQRQL